MLFESEPSSSPSFSLGLSPGLSPGLIVLFSLSLGLIVLFSLSLVLVVLFVLLLVLFLRLVLDLLVVDQLQLDLDLRGNDIVEGISTLGQALLLASYLGDADLIITAERTVLVLCHAVRKELHSLALEDLTGLAAYDLLAVLVDVVVPGVLGA